MDEYLRHLTVINRRSIDIFLLKEKALFSNCFLNKSITKGDIPNASVPMGKLT